MAHKEGNHSGSEREEGQWGLWLEFHVFVAMFGYWECLAEKGNACVFLAIADVGVPSLLFSVFLNMKLRYECPFCLVSMEGTGLELKGKWEEKSC